MTLDETIIPTTGSWPVAGHELRRSENERESPAVTP